MHFYHFLADITFLHTVYILKLFSTAFQPLRVLVIFFFYTPDNMPKFDTIFVIRDNSVTFFSVQIFITITIINIIIYYYYYQFFIKTNGTETGLKATFFDKNFYFVVLHKLTMSNY